MLEVGPSANSMTPNQLRVTFGQPEAMSYFMISVHCGHGINPIILKLCALPAMQFSDFSGPEHVLGPTVMLRKNWLWLQ